MTFLTPMRWPDTWKDPAALDLVTGTAIDYLLIAKGAESRRCARARSAAWYPHRRRG
jgi:hypothetical protein